MVGQQKRDVLDYLAEGCSAVICGGKLVPESSVARTLA